MAEKLKLSNDMRLMFSGALSDKEKSVKRLQTARPQYSEIFQRELNLLADCRKWLAEQV